MKKKLTLVVTCVVLVAAMVIGGTLAYFTDTTEEKKNTFTVGGVDISLTEDSWKEEGDHTLMPGKSFAKDPKITVANGSQDAWVFLKVDLNKYVSLINLMGVDAYKHNIGGLEGEYPGFTAFVNALIADNDLRATVLGRWFTGIDHSVWQVINLSEVQDAVAKVATKVNPAHLEIILGYKTVLSAKGSVTFMASFGMPSTITASMLNGDDAYYIDGVSKSNFSSVNAEGKESPFKMTFTAYAIQAAELKTLDLAYEALFAK